MWVYYIADGSASDGLDVISVTDEFIVGDDSEVHLTKEFNSCTPGFFAWQTEVWWTHCGDTTIYHGMGGRDEIESIYTVGGEGDLITFER